MFVTYRSFKGEIIVPPVKENESRRVIGLLLKSLKNKTVVTNDYSAINNSQVFQLGSTIQEL